MEKTALLTPSAAEVLPGPAAEDAVPPGPAKPSPLEISAADLFRSVDEAARVEAPPPVVAAAALAAVHSSGVTDRPVLDVPSPEPPEPGPMPPASPRRVPEATLSQFPIRGGNVPSASVPPPAIRVRKPRPASSRDASGPEPGGFFRRLGASLVDSVILLALNLLLLSPVFLVLLFRDAFQKTDLLRDWAFLGIVVGCGLMIFGADLWYVVGGWARTGRTPGKALLRLAVVPAGPSAPGSGIGLKKAFVRFLGYGLSGALLGIGYLLVLFRKDRRALHDLLAGTRVVRTP